MSGEEFDIRAARRFNVYVISAAGIAALILLALGNGSAVFTLLTRRMFDGERVPLAQNTTVKTKLSVGQFDRVAGTNYLVARLSAELSAEKATAFGSYSKEFYGNDAVRNFLFVNAKSRESRWLVSGNQNLFLSADSMARNDKPNAPLLTWRYFVVTKDTNKDGSLTEKDVSDLAFSRPDGSGFRTLIPDAQGVLGSTWLDDTRLALIYKTKRGIYLAEINVQTVQVLATKTLPAILQEKL